MHRSTAHVARRERRLGDALANLEDAMTAAALVLVSRHEVQATGEGKTCQHDTELPSE